MLKKWLPRTGIALAVVGLLVVLAVGVVAAQGQQPGRHGKEGGMHLIEAVAEATGLDPADIVEQLQNGKTLGEIVTENGADPDDIIADVLADIEANLGEAVADGRITQEQADNTLAIAAENLPQVMDGTFQPPSGGPQGGFGGKSGPGGPGGKSGRGGSQGGGMHHGGPGFDAMQGLIGLVAEATGLEPVDIVQQLQDGKTLGEIATENGANPDDIISDALDALETRLGEAVADGNLTQEQADLMLANATENLPQVMDGTFTPQPRRGGGRCAPYGHALVGLVAEATGLTMPDVVAELEAGKTLAEVATENGADPGDIIAEALSVLQTRLDEAVADGNMTQEQADTMLANAAEALEDMMNKTFDFRQHSPADTGVSL